MPLPPPTNEDFNWANRLWNTLVIADEAQGRQGGTWDMPSVGRYVRTGLNELTFTEIHGDMTAPDRLGITLFEKHDWICALADGIGWVVYDEVRKADLEESDFDPAEPPIEHIGMAHVCDCSLIYTVRGQDCNERVLVGEEGGCLNPQCAGLLPEVHRGVFNHIDETALIAKMEALERLIAIDEGDLPAPPIPIDPSGQMTLFEEE